MFIKEIKELPPPDKLPKSLRKLMIFDDVEPKEQIIKHYFCRGRHKNCIMINLNQNLFFLDRRGVRENSNLFILFEQRGNVPYPLYKDFFNEIELVYDDFAILTTKVLKGPYNYLVLDVSKKRKFNGKLRINWDRKFF